MRGPGPTSPQARPCRDAALPDRDQPPHLRSVRRLRHRVELSVGAGDRHPARHQDHDRSVELQSRLLVPGRRLPEFHPDHAQSEGREKGGLGCRQRRSPRSRPHRCARLTRPANGRHRWHRCRHCRPDRCHGCDARRPARARARPDRPLAESRSCERRPPHHDRRAGAVEPDRR